MKVLVLDDHRQQKFQDKLSSIGLENVTFVSTAQDCIDALANETYDLIFLDYDLTYMGIEDQADENNGMAVVRWLKDHQMNPNHGARIVIHSVDPFGAQHMKEHIPDAIVMPGAWIESQFKTLVKQLKLKTGKK